MLSSTVFAVVAGTTFAALSRASKVITQAATIRKPEKKYERLDLILYISIA